MPKDHMKVTTKYRWSLKKRKKKKITLLFELLYVMIKTENSWDNQSRWLSRKISHDMPKLQLDIKQLSLRTAQKLSLKRFSAIEDIEKSHIKMGRRGRRTVLSGPTSSVQCPTGDRYDIRATKFLPYPSPTRREDSETHVWFTSMGDQHWHQEGKPT